MEDISHLGLLVGENCQPEDAAGGGQNVCRLCCTFFSLFFFLFFFSPLSPFSSTWSLAINQRGGVCVGSGHL